jgi:hypothetical protein
VRVFSEYQLLVGASVNRESEAVMTVGQKAVSHKAQQSGILGFKLAYTHKESAQRSWHIYSVGRWCKYKGDSIRCKSD